MTRSQYRRNLIMSVFFDDPQLSGIKGKIFILFGFERAYLSSTWENGLSYDNSNHWNLVIL